MTLLMTCLSVTVCVKHSVVVLFFFFFFLLFFRYDLGQVRVFNVHIQNKLL